MPLNRYQDIGKKSSDKKMLNIVVCIYHDLSRQKKSPINEMLEELQKQLKTECKKHSEIQIAYVYETPSLSVKEFEVFTEDTSIYYKTPCEKSRPHSLEHVWFMGLALLEQRLVEVEQFRDVEIENRIYLLTDEKFDLYQSGKIVYEEDGEIFLHPRFSNLDVTSILIKTENAGGELLEKYMTRKHIFKTWEERKNECS